MSNDGIFWTQVGTLLTIILGFVFKWLQDERARRWAIEDRHRTAEELAKKVDITHQEVTAKLETNTHKIEENTAITQEAKEAANQAYSAANNFNEKMAALTRPFESLQEAEAKRRLTQVQRDTDHIKQTTDATLALVQEQEEAGDGST